MCCFISGIQMDADADQHAPEGEMILSAYLKMLQAVIIQKTVIQPFACRPFFIKHPVFFGIPWDAGMETQIGVVLDIDSTSVICRGTFCCMGTGFYPSAFQGAAVFMCILDGVVPPWAHLMSCPAQRMSLFIECDVIRCAIIGCRPSVDIDQGIDAPVFKEMVGRDVVMGRIQTDILRAEFRYVPFELIDGIKKIFAVMASCRRELHQERQVDPQRIVPARQEIHGMSIEPLVLAAVESP